MYNYIYNINPDIYKYSKIHPSIEIIRSKIILKLFDRFYNILIKLNKSFKKDKSDDILTRFIWSNIGNIDPVIPVQEKYNYKQIYIDLKNYKFNPKYVLKKLEFKKVIIFYMKIFDKYYKTINNNVNIIDNGSELIYGKYKIKYTQTIMEKFNKFYNNKFSDKLTLFFCVLFRYSILDAKNQQLAINIPFKNDLKIHYGINIELFGSSINRFFDNFCSLFYDIEQYFGSLGNFFSLDIKQGLYMCNPPYDEELMLGMSNKIIKWFDNTNKPLGFVITIPIWDYETIKQINKKCNTNYTDMGIYEGFELLKKSKYYYKHYKFCKNDFPYYNFIRDININASNTYIIIVKNKLLEFDLKLFENLLLKHNLKTIE